MLCHVCSCLVPSVCLFRFAFVYLLVCWWFKLFGWFAVCLVCLVVWFGLSWCVCFFLCLCGWLVVCLFLCLSCLLLCACSLACLPACLPACLLACLLACLRRELAEAVLKRLFFDLVGGLSKQRPPSGRKTLTLPRCHASEPRQRKDHRSEDAHLTEGRVARQQTLQVRET